MYFETSITLQNIIYYETDTVGVYVLSKTFDFIILYTPLIIFHNECVGSSIEQK